MAGAVHKALLNEVYGMFSLTNPMHSDVFPSVRRMEGEVVAMTASILGGGRGGASGGMPRLQVTSRLQVQALLHLSGASPVAPRGVADCWVAASMAVFPPRPVRPAGPCPEQQRPMGLCAACARLTPPGPTPPAALRAPLPQAAPTATPTYAAA